jgi:hypothetical protein
MTGMSTTESTGVDAALDGCRPASIEPVVVDAADLESTAPGYLRDLKSELARRGHQPAALAVDARFADARTVETTLSALAERARREGVELVRAGGADDTGDVDDA